MAKHIWTTLALIILGLILGTLGAIAVPIGMGVTNFWPGILVQVLGGIWFGLWGGLVAAAGFPMISNLMVGGNIVQIIGFIPANALQGVIPCWAFRHFRMPPGIPGWRGIGFFALWGCIIPNMAGALVGPFVLVMTGELSWQACPGFAWTWFLGNAVPAFVLGLPLLRFGSKMLQEAHLLVAGYWR
jgi:integral membrane sensor domain MASE1